MQKTESAQSAQLNALDLCRQLRTLSVYGVIFFIPLSIAFSDICLSLLLLSYLIETIITRRFSWPPTPLDRPLLAFILLTLLLTPFAVNIGKSFSKLTNLIDLAVFFLFYISIKERPQLQKYVETLLLSMTIGSLYGVLQHFLEIDLFRLSQPISFLKHINNDLSRPVRISGFSSYMTFGGQLAMILPLIFAYTLYSKERRTKILWGSALIINGTALIWTYTRSAWVGSVVAVVVVGYLSRGKTFWKQLLIALLILGTSLVLQQSLDYRSAKTGVRITAENSESSSPQDTVTADPGLIKRMLDSELLRRIFSIFQTQDNLERLYTWQSSLYMLADHPFAGIGHGNYSETCQAYRTRYGDFEFTSDAHAHNAMLQVAVIGGIPSLGVFLWLWFTLFRSSYQCYRQTPADAPKSRALALGAFGALIAFFFHGFFEHNFGDSEVLSMLWLLYALSLALPRKTAEEHQTVEV
ncbi:MAG: hypothetical protein GY801_40475 [bacterium]|nr:hypothetical protein [bacterium]